MVEQSTFFIGESVGSFDVGVILTGVTDINVTATIVAVNGSAHSESCLQN